MSARAADLVQRVYGGEPDFAAVVFGGCGAQRWLDLWVLGEGRQEPPGDEVADIAARVVFQAVQQRWQYARVGSAGVGDAFRGKVPIACQVAGKVSEPPVRAGSERPHESASRVDSATV